MRHIPNILSFFRIVLIPFFVWQMLAGHTFNAAIILGISGLTDLLDGFLARRFGWISQLGKVLDPAADKLTQVTVCVVLAIVYRKYWYFF
ncbi:MAG: CDP-alcohol phosphatidyltransferase family protein, partial [Oscillospiraceae bacterium]|nr:CDP-alcohol phosphatidyltransferase family protein [Oscillospiraceae bacterium]